MGYIKKLESFIVSTKFKHIESPNQIYGIAETWILFFTKLVDYLTVKYKWTQLKLQTSSVWKKRVWGSFY